MRICNLETAQELDKLYKDKGIEMPESAFYWRRPSVVLPHELKYGKPNAHNLDVIPAYTLDEIWDWLPEFIDKIDKRVVTEKISLAYSAKIYGKKLNSYSIYYESLLIGRLKESIIKYEYIPATAACKLAIWLIKEGYLTK